jgi:hypothetical protein
MLTIKTSDRLRTMRNVKSYRACPTSTGQPMGLADRGRRCQEDFLLRQRELRHHWLAAARRHRCCQG